MGVEARTNHDNIGTLLLGVLDHRTLFGPQKEGFYVTKNVIN